MSDLEINNLSAKDIKIETSTPISTVKETSLKTEESTPNIWKNYQKTDTPDGKIQNTKQGEVGDCWLLSEANAMSKTSWGAEAIKNAIDGIHSGDDTDPYKVSLINTEGKKIEINVTNEDLKGFGINRKTYSIGDIDMNLLEAATAKYFTSEIEAGRLDKDVNKALEDGLGTGKYSLGYMLTGSNGQGLTTVEIKPENKHLYKSMNSDNLEQAMIDYTNNPNETAMICTLKKQNFWQKTFGKTSEAEQTPCHSYAITYVEKNSSGKITYVSYQNPWDSSIEYTVPYDTFKKRVEQISWNTGNAADKTE